MKCITTELLFVCSFLAHAEAENGNKNDEIIVNKRMVLEVTRLEQRENQYEKA